jgi:hypothetical protein
MCPSAAVRCNPDATARRLQPRESSRRSTTRSSPERLTTVEHAEALVVFCSNARAPQMTPFKDFRHLGNTFPPAPSVEALNVHQPESDSRVWGQRFTFVVAPGLEPPVFRFRAMNSAEIREQDALGVSRIPILLVALGRVQRRTRRGNVRI